MWSDVEWYVRSCDQCQRRSRHRPIALLNPTWSISILRKINLDTVHMPRGAGGYKYILHAHEDLGSWPEAKASRTNDSKVWSKFIYEEIICRFGCIPLFVTDGGPEFKGLTKIMFEKYKIPVVVSSPYHPEGNGIVERAHLTLVSSLFKTCEGRPEKWPKYLHAALYAMRITATRTTGLSPHFMLYGQHPTYPWDLSDQTWQALQWNRVRDRADLISLRTQQIARRDEDLEFAAVDLQASPEQSARDHALRNQRRLAPQEFTAGTWVLRHKSWLSTQQGNKEKDRWAGPFIIKNRYSSGSYALTELDGTPLLEPVAANRLKIYYYRGESIIQPTEGLSNVQTGEYNLSLKALDIQDHFHYHNPYAYQPDIRINSLENIAFRDVNNEYKSEGRAICLKTDINELISLSASAALRW